MVYIMSRLATFYGVCMLLAHEIQAASQKRQVHAVHVRHCCDYMNAGGESLYSCVMEASDANQNNLLKLFKDETNNLVSKKKYRFGIVTYATSNIWDYASYAAAVNEIFAESNHHVFKSFDDISDRYDEPDPRWSKVKIIADALDPKTEWTRDIDYIVWIDADLIFIDIHMDFDKLVRSVGDHIDIIASAEHVGGSTLINSGLVIAKRTDWSRNFIQRWWTHKSRNLFSDQEIFDMVYNVMDGEEQKRHVAVLAPDVLNSDPPAMEKQQPHNQVMHLMGEHSPFRIKVFGTAFGHLCSHLNEPAYTIPPQLGVHQANLLKWTIQEYKTEMMGLLEDYEPKAVQGLNTLRDSKKLSNSIHHYCHGIKTRNIGNDIEVAGTLRNMSFWLAYKNFNNRRAINERYARANNKTMEPDWPEHLKTVATMGGHLVGLGSIEQRRAAVKLNNELLTELHYLAHEDQKGAVELMIASSQHSFAMIEVEANNFEGALKHTRQQLEMLDRLAGTSGEHILISPLEAEGNILSQLSRYKEAAISYQRAMDIVDKLYGSEHVGLNTLLMNCGISYYMYSQKILKKQWPEEKRHSALLKAEELLQRAQTLLIKGRRLLQNYDNAQGRSNLAHLEEYLGKVKQSLHGVTQQVMKDTGRNSEL